MKRITLSGLTLIAIAGAANLLAAGEPPKPLSTASEGDRRIVHQESIVYGQVFGAGLLADIAYPAAGGSFPVIISVHGGRWRSGHKRDYSTINVAQWAGFGFFAMAIDYRLIGCTPVPACYQDLQCALRFVHAQAETYRIDPSRIFLIGQSAGGHLVSLAATLGEGPWPRTGGWENASNDFRAAISVAACYDLPSLKWGELWTPAGEDPAAARVLASPVRHVRRESKPLLVMHADNDTSVPVANALLMVDALEKAGADFRFYRSPHLGHMGIIDEVIIQARQFIAEHSR